MSVQIDTSARDEIEAMLDRHGLQNILDALAAICADKAEHLRSNWQDEATAKAWEHESRRLEALANEVDVP